ncbi:MAG: MBL fold metallo-hydrolase, partial [Clostridia bacterium]|nr:MBL fold metallo-hydrolase [Clostridia bacterium]
MQKLTERIYYVGVKDPNLKVFDIIMDTEYGTTYNSYIVKGEKTALIETSHNKFSDEFIANIEQVVPVSDIDYIILNHTEPDHSGALEKILKINPDITIVGTIAALKNLKEITNTHFNELLAKDNSQLDLGGTTLKFIIAPNLHWPDTMMTYCKSERTLFSCDVLGAHYCSDGVTDKSVQAKADYDKAFKEYYESIISPFKPFVLKAMDKLSGLDIEYIMTSHGPVLTKFIDEGIEKYIRWSAEEKHSKKQVIIFCVSAYGYTKMLADTAKETLLRAGIDAVIIDPTECGGDTISNALK